MKRLFMPIITVLCILLLFGCNSSDKIAVASPDPESDKVVVTFNYKNQSGYASNQFAVWIEDMNGNYIKTLYATLFTANGGYRDRPDSIPMWVEKTDLSSMTKSEVDIIAGATPKEGMLSYSWDLKDKNGDSVPAGKYKFFVEGSLRWKNRAVYSGVIEIGGISTTVEANAEYFYEDSDDQPALSDDSPENSMIGLVTAQFVSSGHNTKSSK